MTWTDETDTQLRAAVEACLPLREVFPSARHGWWACVVGRLGLPVTPDAVRSRWDRIERKRQDEEAATKAALEAATAKAVAGPPVVVESAWDRTARMVEEYERSCAEATLDTVTETAAVLAQVQRSQGRIERMLAALCRAWDVRDV